MDALAVGSAAVSSGGVAYTAAALAQTKGAAKCLASRICKDLP